MSAVLRAIGGALLLCASSVAQLEVSSSEFLGGGTLLSGGAFELRGSVGSHDGATQLAGGALDVDGGHWPGICGGTIEAYGSGCPGSGGFLPQLAFGGCFGPGDLTTITIAGGLGGSQAFLMLGVGRTAAPFGAGCTLYVAIPTPLIGPLPLFGAGPGNGLVSFPVLVPPDLTYAWGSSVTWQAYLVDPGSTKGFTASNGVETTIG